MTKAFSLASWNVEHFKGTDARAERVVAFLKTVDPDVFALYEVEGKEVFAALTAGMPSYQFHITEGPQVQEILVGVRQGLTAFFTQKLEFKEGNPSLRPGALLTITIGSTNYPILFLHTKSGSAPIGWGIRDDMMERALEFKEVLKKAEGGPKPNYIFLGDLNTMGMSYLLKEHNIPADHELQKLDKAANKAGMRRLSKTSPYTWWNGPQSDIPPSDLDQVVAAQHLEFQQFEGQDVLVHGWPEKTTDAEKAAWIKDYSDHGLLYLEVQMA